MGNGKRIMNYEDRKDMIVLQYMMVGKEEVDCKYVSLLCSTQVGYPLVYKYVVCTVNSFEIR